ncbi:MAG: FG-GAP-like repeat-containing protein [Pyrinomonadaceae bacterium]
MLEDLLKRTTRTAGIKAVPESIEIARATGANFQRRELFAPTARLISRNDDLYTAVSRGVLLDLDKKAIRNIIAEAPKYMTLSIPDGNGGFIDLDLEQADIFAPGFKVSTSAPTGQSYENSLGNHYRGMIKGEPLSLVAISIFPNEVMGSIRSKALGNSSLGRLTGNNRSDTHIFFDTNDLKTRPENFCNVRSTGNESASIPVLQEQSADAVAARVTRIYVEANFDVFQNKGSVPNTIAYVAGFFNQSAALFANDGIFVSLSETFVWNTVSPYGATNDAGVHLNAFTMNRPTYIGNLAHLITLIGYGGIANLDSICPNGYAVSGIEPTFNNVPTFSWTVEVFTHETGHNLGSDHTQACVWNGNNTAIDGCVAVEPGPGGTCATPPAPPGGGTIMSYCHLNAVGIDFLLGFGPQPKALILGKIAGAACLTSTGRAPYDFDGDNKTDVGIYRPAAGEWWYLRSSNGTNSALQFGNATDKIVPSDYTGDGKTDIAIWRPATGQWFILRSEDLSFFAFPFGANGDVPVPADFDGDGKSDPSVFRPTTQTWFINRSTGGTTITGFGAAGDVPVVGNYDGDTKADIAIFRPNAVGGAQWWIQRSSNNTVLAMVFGASTDKAVQGDYTGDGKTDVAIWRPSNGNWFILRSEDFSFFAFPFGANGDLPVPGDYDGDGKFDAGVFRPASATWFVQRSTAGTLIQSFGTTGDQPVPNVFVP